MRQEDSVCHNVAEADEIVVSNNFSRLLVVVPGKNLPVVVGVIVWVSGHLLTLAGDTTIVVPQRVLVRVAVKIRLGLLMSKHSTIAVLDGDGVL